MHPITTLRCRLLTHFLAVQLETWYHDVNVSFKLLSCLEHRKIISHLAISSCGCPNSGPSPHCPWCSEALGNLISTPIYDQIVLEGAGPAGDQLRISGWEVYLQRLGHLIFLSNSHEFSLVETPTKQQLPKSIFNLSPTTTTKKSTT